MHRQFMWTTLILSCALLLGCGGENDVGDNAAVAPSAPPPVADTDTTTDNDNTDTEVANAEVTNTGTPAGGDTGTGTEITGTENTLTPDPPPSNNGGEGIATIVAEGALAAHAKALSIVRPDHYAIVKFDLEGARQTQLFKDLPGTPEELAQGFAGDGGVPQAAEAMTSVDLVWLSIGPPTDEFIGPDAPPFAMSAYARFKTEEALQERIADFGIGENVEATHSGVKYFRPETPGEGPIFFSNDVELFLSTDEATIHQIIDAKGKIADVPLLAKLKDVNLDTHVLLAGSLGPMREPVTQMLSEMLQQSPLPLAPTTANLPAQIEWGTVAIDLDAETLIDIDLDMDKPANAEVMKMTLDGLKALGAIGIQQFQKNVPDDPAMAEMFATAKKVLAAITVENAGKHVDLSLAHLPELDKLPELIAATQSRPQVSDLANARQVALAANNLNVISHKWPNNIVGKDGTPLLSWRVALLPFLEQHALFEGVDQTAAWDSKANIALSDTEIPTYNTETIDAASMTTLKLLPEAPGGIMFIITGKGTEVHWASPDVFAIDPADPMAALGPEPEGGYVVAYRDARVMRMSKATLLKALGIAAAPLEEPKPQPRTWTTADGKNSVEAQFVKLDGDQVTLKRSDNGKEVSLPAKLLSEEDQAYLRSLSE